MKAFDTMADAWRWIYAEVDDPCIDNERCAEVGNAEQEARYEALRKAGCCGDYDVVVMVAGIKRRMGCNYGH